MKPRTVFRIAALIAPVLAGVVAGEAWFRVTRVTRLDGDFHVPGGRLTYRGGLGEKTQPYVNEVRWNAQGEFDRDWPDPPELVLVGDSFVEAIQVPLSEHVSTRLGAAKLGTSGHGPLQELAALERARARGWRPARVVLVFTAANDLRNSLLEDRPIRTGLWLANWLLAKTCRPGWGEGDDWDAAWRRMFWALDRLRGLVPFLAVALATEGEPNAWVVAWCEASGIPWTSCADAETISNDGHWTARGHALAAERISALLARSR